MANKPFQKFIGKKEGGAQKKERIRQEKKKIREETKAYFEKKKAEKRAMWQQQSEQQNTRFKGKPDRPGNKPPQTRQPIGDELIPSNTNIRPGQKGSNFNDKKPAPERPVIEKKTIQTNPAAFRPQVPIDKQPTKTSKPAESMPLNKYIAHAGVCSRRDAADLVKSGKITVNGKKVIEPGFKVAHTDEVKVNGKKIFAQRNLVYILLNKPKDFITTTEDPQGRKTVLDIVKSATTERVYPIGRLDRNTTGVLLLTNDGELAQKLSHPSYEIKKIYEVTLDKQVSKKDFETLANGVTLEDGFVRPDAVAYPDTNNKHIIGIEIHSGRNRIVRRIFEHLGYDVRNLDRVMYANLTKKNVDRGKWRFLSEKEIRLLKYLNASYTKK